MADLEKLFNDHIGLVYYIVGKFKIHESHLDDIIQECLLKLWTCCKEYDSTKNAKFSTFAFVAITNRAISYLTMLRGPSYQHYDLHDVTYDPSFVKRIEFYDQIDQLEKKYKTVIDLKLQGYSNTEVANKLGCCKQLISRVLTKDIRKRFV